MNLYQTLTERSELFTKLQQVAKCSECLSFADLCWDRVDPLALEPGIKIECAKTVLVLQMIKGEIRYYAGGWGDQQSIETEPNEFGTLQNLSEAVSLIEQFIMQKAPLVNIHTPPSANGDK
jgi:hypothetical protein